MTENDSPLAQLKTLSEITSSCYKTSNRAWLALMAASAVVLLPRSDANSVTLPFSLGTVPQSGFFLVAFVLLVALAIAFGSAHAQGHLAQRLARRFVAKWKPTDVVEPLGIHPRDLFDAMQGPAMNRVAPLSQLVLGDQHQFLPEAADAPRGRTILSVTHYVILKLVSLVFYFAIPLWALWQAFSGLDAHGPVRWIARIGLSLAALSVAQVAWLELRHTSRVATSRFGTKSDQIVAPVAASVAGTTP